MRWLQSPWLGRTVSDNDAKVSANDANFKANPGPYRVPYCALPIVLVLEQARLGKRCHSLNEWCQFLSESGSLLRSVLRTINDFGFRASACVVDFNVKWRRYWPVKSMSVTTVSLWCYLFILVLLLDMSFLFSLNLIHTIFTLKMAVKVINTTDIFGIWMNIGINQLQKLKVHCTFYSCWLKYIVFTNP